jgi:hypothetical protein
MFQDWGNDSDFWHSKIPLTPFSRGKLMLLLFKRKHRSSRLEDGKCQAYPLKRGLGGFSTVFIECYLDQMENEQSPKTAEEYQHEI